MNDSLVVADMLTIAYRSKMDNPLDFCVLMIEAHSLSFVW